MATPAQGKPSYEITGLWVRTNPVTQELEVLVEHEGVWRVAFGEASSVARGQPIPHKLPLKVEAQTIDHCIHPLGLERLPIEACGLSDRNCVTRCDLEAGHDGTEHVFAGEFRVPVHPVHARWHELRQAKRRPFQAVESAVERVRRVLRRRR